MSNLQNFDRASPASSTATSSLFLPLFISNLFLSALSIANLGLISSMVAFLLDQKHRVHSYRINWPAATFDLNVEPANLVTDHGNYSNAVAAYGFLLGIFGMITAWKVRQARGPLKFVTILLILQFLAVLFTLGALAFAFVVTNKTSGEEIRAPIAANNQGVDYAEYKWTPETWFKAVLDLPLADQGIRDQITSKITIMAAWRYMLCPIFITDIIAFGVTTLAWLRQRKMAATRVGSSHSMEKRVRGDAGNA